MMGSIKSDEDITAGRENLGEGIQRVLDISREGTRKIPEERMLWRWKSMCKGPGVGM